jgi:hypothetical protein
LSDKGALLFRTPGQRHSERLGDRQFGGDAVGESELAEWVGIDAVVAETLERRAVMERVMSRLRSAKASLC